MVTIRKMKVEDVKKLTDIWLQTSLKAHDFIPGEYWHNNKSLMEEKYLPNSEVYIAQEGESIHGFIALAENHVASIFVSTELQGKGTGTLLLDYAKKLRQELTLSVYQKNVQGVGFYKSKGFKVVGETIDQPTGEKEFSMLWIKED
jgi:putative acetyltransferase